MQVYKFGGASVKDAQSVRNVFSILEKTEKKDIVFNLLQSITPNFDDEIISFIKKYENLSNTA